jgi:hypothetical protein
MKRLLIILVLSILYSSYSQADDLTLYRDAESLFMNIKVVYKGVNELKKRLSSGLSNKIVISVKLKDKKSGKTIVDRGIIFEAIYDVWEEKYRLYSFDPLKTLILETNSKEEIFNRFLNPAGVKICNLHDIPSDGLYNLKLSILINPVSKEIVEKIKEYLSDPESIQKGSSTRTIFGSFANVFIPELNVENSIKLEIRSFRLQEIEEKR